MAKESRFAITSKAPLSLQANSLISGTGQKITYEEKLKTQDVREIIRKVNQHDFNESAAEPYEEDDCVVRETDPEEQHYPKHEPA